MYTRVSALLRSATFLSLSLSSFSARSRGENYRIDPNLPHDNSEGISKKSFLFFFFFLKGAVRIIRLRDKEGKKKRKREKEKKNREWNRNEKNAGE